MVLEGYFIQYKFIVPETIKHSSYTYQKLFRALYGYTQNVCKSSGKVYKYHRAGILSDVPYLRPGKNCVVIPKGVFTQLTDFFKTGKNPSHYWQGKGDWKAVYYMNEKSVTPQEAAKAIENMLVRKFVTTTSAEHESLDNELNNIGTILSKGSAVDPGYKSLLLKEAEKVVSNPWFRDSYKASPKLTNFYSNYKAIRK